MASTSASRSRIQALTGKMFGTGASCTCACARFGVQPTPPPKWRCGDLARGFRALPELRQTGSRAAPEQNAPVSGADTPRQRCAHKNLRAPEGASGKHDGHVDALTPRDRAPGAGATSTQKRTLRGTPGSRSLRIWSLQRQSSKLCMARAQHHREGGERTQTAQMQTHPPPPEATGSCAMYWER